VGERQVFACERMGVAAGREPSIADLPFGDRRDMGTMVMAAVMIAQTQSSWGLECHVTAPVAAATPRTGS
jgi:hypothetical protein